MHLIQEENVFLLCNLTPQSNDTSSLESFAFSIIKSRMWLREKTWWLPHLPRALLGIAAISTHAELSWEWQAMPTEGPKPSSLFTKGVVTFHPGNTTARLDCSREISKNNLGRDFSWAETLHSQCRGAGFDSWSRLDPTCCNEESACHSERFPRLQLRPRTAKWKSTNKTSRKTDS